MPQRKRQKRLNTSQLSEQVQRVAAEPEETTVYKIYRKTSMGRALYAALTECINEEEFPEELAQKAFDHYDLAVSQVFSTSVNSQVSEASGTLDVYRFCQDSWEFYLKDFILKTRGNPVTECIYADKLHIVASEARLRKTGKSRRR